MKVLEGLTFDDVLLVPKHSEIKSRSEIDTSVDLGKGVKISTPIIPANMKSIMEESMCEKMLELGSIPILHRFMSIEENVKLFKSFNGKQIACSVGVRGDEIERAEELFKEGCRIFCVDIAHGDHVLCIETIKRIRRFGEDVLIIAGNVSTAEGALGLWKAGADVIKVGVGPGSLCTTRIETGNGVPQLTALMSVHNERAKNNADFKIIADGGIQNAGDIVKALCFSEAVMLGSIFAGTDETPGDIITINDKQYKKYEGSSTHKTSHIEGVSAVVTLKGPVETLMTKLMEGVRSGCSYQGTRTLLGLQDNPVFVKISHAGLTESRPHLIER